MPTRNMTTKTSYTKTGEIGIQQGASIVRIPLTNEAVGGALRIWDNGTKIARTVQVSDAKASSILISKGGQIYALSNSLVI